jgi:hypothetical protein
MSTTNGISTIQAPAKGQSEKKADVRPLIGSFAVAQTFEIFEISKVCVTRRRSA